MEQELKQGKISSELKVSIIERCLEQGKSRTLKTFNIYKVLSKIAVWFIGIILTFSGTVYAMSHVEGFDNFLEKTILQTITPHVQTINKEDRKDSTKLVVEATIVDHYKSLLIFSLINEGEEPWPEGVKLGYLSESWITSATYGPPILSEDGKKLTYFVDGYGNQDILENNDFELTVGNIIKKVEIEEDIDIPLGELFEVHNTVLDTADYDLKSSELYMKLNRTLKKEIGTSQRQFLKQDPIVTFEYVGMIQDSKTSEPDSLNGGLTIYTRNESYKYWTNSTDNYVLGTISEVTDTRTGQVYKSDRRAIENDIDTLWRGALGVSQFSELMDPSVIPYLKATKIIYKIQEVIVKDDWKVKFQVKDTTTIKPVKTNLNFIEGSESLTIEQIECSVLGVTLQGIESNMLEDHSGKILSEKMMLSIRMKDGLLIPLTIQSRSSIMNSSNESNDCYIYTFGIINEDDEIVFLDTNQIEAIIINGEEVMIP